MNKNSNILFIKEENSEFNYETQAFDSFFEKVEMVLGEQKALKLIYKNKYDVIVNDMSVDVEEGITLMKQLKEMKPQQEFVSLVLPKDEERIGDLMEAGVHTFVLTLEQFDQALEAIAHLDPAAKD
ncbi:MAG: response regulator [Campylobacterota bacterium]|nr:response regulator [Campylobacterota bacterium]